jgi:hypothetical protein
MKAPESVWLSQTGRSAAWLARLLWEQDRGLSDEPRCARIALMSTRFLLAIREGHGGSMSGVLTRC